MGSMSKHELEIEQIEDIHMIHFYDYVTRLHNPTIKNQLGLLVCYGDNKQLNYCEADSCFHSYFRKVVRQYQIEKSQKTIVIEENPTYFHQNPIRMDERTKSILEHATTPFGVSAADFYKEKTGVTNRFLSYGIFQIQEIQNILFYHLKQIYQISFNVKKMELEEMTGYRDYFTITVQIDGVHEQIPCYMETTNGFEYTIRIGSHIPMRFLINFQENNIKIHWSYTNELLSGSFIYTIQSLNNQLEMRSKTTISSKETLQYSKEEMIPEVSQKMPEVLPFLYMDQKVEGEYHLFELPWNAYYAYQIQEKELGDSYQEEKEISVYFEKKANRVILKQYNQKKIQKKGIFYIRTDGFIKNTNLHLLPHSKSYGVCETHFEEIPYALGDYKHNIAGKNFYHAVELANGFQEISDITLLPIDMKEIELGYQLLEQDTIEKILKRGVK